MSTVVDRLLCSMAQTVGFERLRGVTWSLDWHIAWHFRPYRLSGQVKENVFVIEGIEFFATRQGYGSEFLERLTAAGEIGPRRFDYVAMTNCNDHALALGRKCGFTIDDPHFLRVAWRRARQLRLPLEDSCSARQ
ncbi:MAG: hypothetical protein EOQ56_27970 [Mesorhizobium sp.]|nr:MAG: hypothetical protein EOQ56_27970 [Mesorhizobium sp.]